MPSLRVGRALPQSHGASKISHAVERCKPQRARQSNAGALEHGNICMATAAKAREKAGGSYGRSLEQARIPLPCFRAPSATEAELPMEDRAASFGLRSPSL